MESAKDAFLRRFAWEGGHADVWRVFDDGAVFAEVVAALVEPWRSHGITKVCGIEARGFILGGAAATALGVGFVAIRKQGNLFPGPKRQIETAPDYRNTRHVLQIQQRSVRPNDRVLLVDDWIERGSQATAARALIEGCGGALAGIAVMVDQLHEDDRVGLPDITRVLSAKIFRSRRRQSSADSVSLGGLRTQACGLARLPRRGERCVCVSLPHTTSASADLITFVGRGGNPGRASGPVMRPGFTRVVST